MNTLHNFDWSWEGIGNDIEADYLEQFEPRPHYTETWSWLMAQERERAWFQLIWKCNRCKDRWAPQPYMCGHCRAERTERNRTADAERHAAYLEARKSWAK